MRWFPASVLMLVISLNSALEAQETPDLAIVGVSVVDVVGNQILTNRTVSIMGGIITSVTPGGTPAPGARVVDGRGKFLIPGLWDMHAHSVDMWLALNVANGVTGVRDMGNDLDEIMRLRAGTASGAIVGPRIFAAGPILDDPPGDLPLRRRVRNAQEARVAVRELAARGVNLIKVHNYTPRDAFFAIAEEGSRAGLPFAGHVPLQVEFDEAIEAGITSIEHFSEDGREWKWCSGGRVYRADACAPFFKLLADKRVWQTPTLIAITEYGVTATPASRIGMDQMVYVPKVIRDFWAANAQAIGPTALAALHASGEVAPIVTKDMVRAGVGVLSGCDGLIAGVCVHAELALMVAGGLTPAEALRTATINPARYLGLEATMGTVQAGKAADLVLLDANPLADIANVGRIHAVLLKGRLFDRAALDELLAEVRDAAAN